MLEKSKVLVLNKNWQAIKIINAKKAINLLFSIMHNGEPKAKIIDPDNDFCQFTWNDWSKISPREGEKFIKSCNGQFKVPEIILLTKYDKIPSKTPSKFSRRMLFKRDNFQCQYCGIIQESELLTIDHVVPRSKGGTTTWENCVCCCIDCNSKKANKTLEEVRMKLKNKPIKPNIKSFTNNIEMYNVKSWSNFISQLYWDVPLDD